MPAEPPPYTGLPLLPAAVRIKMAANLIVLFLLVLDLQMFAAAPPPQRGGSV